MKKSQNGGYVGLVSLLIAVAIICFFAVKIYTKNIPDSDVKAQGITPIEQAEEAKKQLERSGVQINQHINVRPRIIYPGDPVLITVDGTPTEVLWDKKVIPFFVYEGKMRAIVPITFEEKILKHIVSVTFNDGTLASGEVTITPRKKIEKPLGIPEKLGGNTPQAATDIVKKLAEENYILNTVKTEPATLWTKAFDYPLTSVYITDNYGYSRSTVGQTITHKGTDFRAKTGTEVKAMNKGIVRLARTFTVYGNTVVIDHGLGVSSLYMHLSKLNVKEGDVVERGKVVGLSGDTGYANAPHLHLSIKINGISIDPMTFLKFFVL